MPSYIFGANGNQSLRVLPAFPSSNALLARYHHTRWARHLVSPYSEACTGHRLGKAFRDNAGEVGELLFTPSTVTSTVGWPLRTTSPGLKVPKSFPGPWPANACKITKTPSSRFRDPELPNPWVPQHLVVPPSSEKEGEIRDPLICLGVFPGP